MKYLIILLLSLSISSCFFAPTKKSVKLEYDIPESFIGLKNLDGYTVKKENVSNSNWWESFNDSKLNDIVDITIKNNLDLQLAASRVELIESQFKLTRARRLPGVSVSSGYTKAEGPQPTFSVGPTGMVQGTEIKTSDQYSLRAGLRWELDIWGKLRNTSKAAVAELMASKEDLRSVFFGIISQTIIFYYDVEASKQQVLLAEQNLEVYESNMQTQKSRYLKGVSAKLNIELTTQALEGAKAKLEREKQTLALKQHGLAILMGEYPKSNDNIKEEEKNFFPSLNKLPNVLPSVLLKSRPDILSAEFKIESARQSVGAARADLFPSISLSLGYGYATSALDDIFSADYLMKSIGGELAQTIFAGGSKLANIDAKKVMYKQAILNYKKVLLNAFKDVEDALVKIKTFENQRLALSNQANAALRARNEMELRYLKGIFPYDKFLDSEKSLFNVKSGLINVELACIVSRVMFHKATSGESISYGK